MERPTALGRSNFFALWSASASMTWHSHAQHQAEHHHRARAEGNIPSDRP